VTVSGQQDVLLKVRNSVAFGLVTLSVALLLVLQVFWLHSSYENAYVNLGRESTIVFRNTVSHLRDSLFVTTLNTGESTADFFEPPVAGNIQLLQTHRPLADSLIVRAQPSSVQVFISSNGPGDSLLKTIGPFTSKLKAITAGSRTFTIRIAPDSLPVDSLARYLKQNLLKESIPANVHVAEAMVQRPFTPRGLPAEFWTGEEDKAKITTALFQDTLRLQPIPLNPYKRYTASLSGLRPIVLKRMAPQLAFSAFLTVTIITAFAFMFRMLRSQQKLMALKNDFISNITHELKTPVATVSVALEALQNFDVAANPTRSREYMAIAQQELIRLSTMTDKVLKTTLFEEQGMAVAKEPIDFRALIQETLLTMKVLVEKQEASVTLQTHGRHFTVMGSAVHLASVVTNLLENSLKYSSRLPTISVTLSEHDTNVHLSVKDNGMGIGEEYHAKIFEKFFRVPTGDVHTIKGYGLGLSFVAGVVKAHYGTIELISKIGEGSEFILRFPLHRAS
jgi:two-component system, OmpR family, phosphate regulon sensor histidine kinase PhoR